MCRLSSRKNIRMGIGRKNLDPRKGLSRALGHSLRWKPSFIYLVLYVKSQPTLRPTSRPAESSTSISAQTAHHPNISPCSAPLTVPCSCFLWLSNPWHPSSSSKRSPQSFLPLWAAWTWFSLAVWPLALSLGCTLTLNLSSGVLGLGPNMAGCPYGMISGVWKNLEEPVTPPHSPCFPP